MANELEREILWQAEVSGRDHLHAGISPSLLKNSRSLLQNVFHKFGFVSIADKILVSAGLTAALASAGFAALMMSTDHSHPMFGGIEHLMLFAQPIHGEPSPAVARLQDGTPNPGIDYSATGTIPGSGAKAGAKTPPQGSAAPSPSTEPVITSYVLQEARPGLAVVQGRDTAYRVQSGSFLPGAGRVISVELRDGKWVVVTTQGVIVDHLAR